MRVVFAGTPAFAVPCLQALLAADEVEVAGVYTRPDRRAGRGRERRPSPVKRAAEARGAAVYQPARLGGESEIKRLKRLTPDLLVVVAFGQLLPAAVLAVARLGCINLHASLLPRWRGAAPIQRAIEAGDPATGVTLMKMERGLDAGPVLASACIPIAARDTAGGLHDKLSRLAARLLADNLPALAAGQLDATPQDETLACHAPKLSPAEAMLDWRLDAVRLERRVRAFNPWPVAFTEVGGMRLRVWRAAVAEARPAQPGEVLAADAAGITVATADGALALTEVQKAGGRAMAAGDFLNGMTITPGMRCAGAAGAEAKRAP
ncbi:MAG: methionyl-tRNA formyltransferase [Gammaproteobacteria bacterium]|nr:methionyl-tRNA formyltransferase [Gammaproteobacteria bacterium]